MAEKPPAPMPEVPKKKGKKKLLLILVVLLAVLGGGGGYAYSASSNSKASSAHPTTTTTRLGKIVRLAPITLNLSDGHVLKVGIALQMVDKPKDKELAAMLAGGGGEGKSSAASAISDSPLSGNEAKALDQAIAGLGDKTFAELSKPGGKQAAKEELSRKIHEIYEGDVVYIYYTDFVMS